MKLRGRLVICIIIGMLLVGCFLCHGVFGDGQSVSLTLTPKPKIDIALSKGQTSVGLSSFENDVKSKLGSLGVDTSDVQVKAIETETFSTSTSSASSIMNTWKKYPEISGNNFEAQWTLDGDTMYTKANVHWTGYWNKSAVNDSDYTIQVSIQNPDTDPCGYTFRMQEPSTNNYKFYAVELDNAHQTLTLARIDSWIPSASDQMHGGPLYHTQISSHDNTYSTYQTNESGNGLSHCTGDRLQYVTYNFIKNNWYDLKIEAKGNNFKIYIGGVLLINYTDNSSNAILSGGYGPYTASDPNGRFKSSTIVTENVKSLTEIMRLPEWRDESLRFLVHVEDKRDADLDNSGIYGEIITKLANEDVHFLGWGTSNNQSQFQELISLNSDRGKYIPNSNYSTAITQTAQYIKDLLNSLQSSQYIILNEPMSISASPPEALKGTVDNTWTHGKWKIVHDYTFFENDLGQFSNSNRYISDFITVFDKVGKFSATYANVPITPNDIYVHRRPTALFSINRLNATTIQLTSNSFDLDKQSTNNGILKEQWRYREISSNSWQTGKLSSISSSKEYIIELKVQDYQNTWSKTVSKYITYNKNVPPIALFSVVENPISKYETFKVSDESYDPAGSNIKTWKWELYKGNSMVETKTNSTGETPFANFNSSKYGEGKYTLYLTVTNSENKVSEKFGRSFTVTDDVIAPEFVAEPVNSEWKKSQEVDFKFTDRGGSGFNSWQYVLNNTEDEPSSWPTGKTITNKDSQGNFIDSLNITEEGEKYLHVKASDKSGNISVERLLGPYKIDHTNPVVEVTADLNTITTQPININIHSTDALSGIKKVTVNGQTLDGLENTIAQVSKNGTYNLQVEDVAGNIYTQSIEVTNIYRNCTAGLDHPIYSSTMDSCPICDLIEGLQVTKDSTIYNAQEQKVTYSNPHNAEIVEYYNGSTTKPVEVGTYNYELKVKYNGEEYNTGKTGQFTINQKTITITDIVAKNREYNGTTIVELEGGTLVGVEASDINDVQFVLSPTGTIPNKNVGHYNVTIPEITLKGAKAKNYKLTQPSETDVTVDITKKQAIPGEEGGIVKVKDIKAIDRQYNATDVVDLVRGTLVGIEEVDKDKVDYVLSPTGTIPNKNVGEYNVTIPEITLIGEEAGNYDLTQPAPDEVSVTISQKDITIEDIVAKNREYNGTNIVELEGGRLVGVEDSDIEKVQFILPPTGTIPNKNIGEYFVTIPTIELEGEEASNYNLIQPSEEAVSVKISKKQVIPGEEGEENGVVKVKDIKAIDRQYNATDIVELQRGTLVGIEEVDKDKVDYVLSETGTIPNKDVGEYNVTIPEITLIGEEAENYDITQPAPDEVSVTISQKDITIENITSENRQYDGTTTVKLQGGELVGVEEIDKEEVQFVLSETGTIESKNIGEYNVIIPEITLEGEEAKNYKLTQPAEDAVKVEITKRELTIEDVKGKDRKYNKTDEVEIVEGKLQNVVEGEDVKAVYPKTGKSENADIGTWEVTIEDITLEGEDIENYELIQPETKDILVTISKPNQPHLVLDSSIEKINGKNPEKADKIRYGDEVQLLIKITNEGTGAGYAQKIEDIIPKGMEFVEENEINEENGWKETSEKGTVETEIFNFESGEENEIAQGKEGDTEEQTNEEKENTKEEQTNEKDEEETKDENLIGETAKENIKNTEEQTKKETENTKEEQTNKNKGNNEKEIRIVLKVTDSEGKNKEVENESIITQADIRGEEIEYEKDENKVSLPITISYSDLSINQKIVQMEKISDTQEKLKVDGDGKLAKVEISRKKDETTKVKVTYSLEVSNKGNETGTVESIVATVPEGMSLSKDSNNAWKELGTDMVEYNKKEEIIQGKNKNIELTLEGIASETMGEKESEAMIISSEDADQRKVEQGKKEEITVKNVKNKMKNTNNYSSATAIISVTTALKDYAIYVLIAIIVLVILAIVIKNRTTNTSKEEE